MPQFRIAKTPARENVINRLLTLIPTLPDSKEWAVEIKQYRKKRTNPQNALYWKWVHKIATETGNEPELIHEYMKEKFLPPQTITIAGQSAEVPGSTTKINTKDMTDFMNWVEQWAASELGIILPHPEDQYYEEWA